MLALRNATSLRRASRRQSHLSDWYQSPVEPLEGRTLLAGNVVTTPTGTPTSPGEPAPTLVVTGDELDNEITIKKGATADEIIVNGLNGTRVNGSTQEWHYQGVRQLFVGMDGGDDVVKLLDLKLSATPGPVGGPFEGVALFDVEIDGGTGDDQINVSNTTFNAKADDTSASTAGMLIIGDATDATTAPTTGNDWIDVNNTTLIADGGFVASGVLQIAGDSNFGGTITEGNDHINVSNTTIHATNTSIEGSSQAAVIVYGDQNLANAELGAPTSVIGQGNDWIDVNGTQIITESTQGASIVFVQILGDSNIAAPSPAADPRSVVAVGGGNDTISLRNTTVSSTGGNFSESSAFVEIQGDQNVAAPLIDPFGNITVPAGQATIGVGNDNISVDNLVVNATGVNTTNSATLAIFGDGNYIPTGLFNFGQIGVGNDTISVSNTDVTATGTPNNIASLALFSDDQVQTPEDSTAPGEGTTVGEGDDNVQLSNFLLEGLSQADIQLHTQKGDDVVDVLNCEFNRGIFDMGAGNDDLTFNSNTYLFASLVGGPGIDRLSAHGNSVPPTFVPFADWEMFNVS